MKSKDNTKKKCERGSEQKPLFTGDRVCDAAVSEFEKVAETSQAIFDALKKRVHKKKDRSS